MAPEQVDTDIELSEANDVDIRVEAPCPAVRLIRVAGRLDRAVAAGVLRLVSAQLNLVAGRHRAVTDLVLDIGAVSSFELAGLEALCHAPYSAGRHGIGLSLSGCGRRVHQLPLRARGLLLKHFRAFPSADVALQEIAKTAGSPQWPVPREVVP